MQRATEDLGGVGAVSAEVALNLEEVRLEWTSVSERTHRKLKRHSNSWREATVGSLLC